jgi:hypothetical protein
MSAVKGGLTQSNSQAIFLCVSELATAGAHFQDPGVTKP